MLVRSGVRYLRLLRDTNSILSTLALKTSTLLSIKYLLVARALIRN